MTWIDAQWAMLFDLLDNGWPGELTEEAAAAYRTLLDGMEPQAVVTGLRRLLVRGQRFRPSAAELVGAAREDPTQPTFAEAYRLMFMPSGAVSEKPRGGIHPLVTSFVARHGSARLRMLPLEDPEWGEKHRRDLERDWGAHVAAMEGRETAQLASGGEPRQLDPLAMAGLTPPRQLPQETA